MAYVKCIRNLISSTVPDGKTVTPTDDISIWLACGGRSETYTTLSQVLADSTCLSALINDNNAVDYLVRSTTWASDVCGDSGAMTAIGGNNYAANTLLADSTWCAAICNSTYFESVLNVKVPILSQNTSEIISNGQYGDDYPQPAYQHPQYRAFDGDNTSYWLSREGVGDRYIGYDFNESVQLCKVTLNAYLANNDVLIKGSNDGTNWTTIKTIPKADVPNNTTVSFDIFELTKYSKYIASSYVPNASGSDYAWYGNTIQFYGRADI